MNNHLDILSRAKGCLLGLAIGDAMGMPTSFLTISAIRQAFGRIEDFQAPPPMHPYHQGLRRGEITDDTEQSLALARSFIRCGRVDPNDVVEELLAWAQKVENKYASPFGPSTKRAFELIENDVPLEQAGRNGDTNGAAMRIAPLGIIHGVRGSSLEETVRDVVLVCMPTHGTQVAIAAAAAVAWAIALGFQRHTSPLDILNGAKEAAYLGSQFGHQIIAPSIARRIAWVSDQISNQRDTEKSLVELYELFGGGVSAADSIPVALGVFAFCQGNPQQIILTASNMGGDTDTIGAISAAIGGVYSGDEAIPADWASMVQSTNQIDLTEIARSLVALASRWVPAGESQIPSLVQGGDV